MKENSKKTSTKTTTAVAARDIDSPAMTLVETAAMCQAMLQASHDLIVVVDREGTILLANDEFARFIGRSPGDLVSRSLFDLVSPENRESGLDVFQQVLRTGQAARVDAYARERHLEHSFAPILDGRGNVTRVVICSHDITDTRQAEEALERKRIALQEMLAEARRQEEAVGQAVLGNINSAVLPLVRSLRQGSPARQQAAWDELERSLQKVASPFAARLSDKALTLTPAQIRISRLIAQGLSSKDIAAMEHLAPATVNKHREHIRRKLGITNEAVSLPSILAQMLHGEQGTAS